MTTLEAYAAGTDLVARFDIDLVGDLATDGRKTLSHIEVPDHPNVLTALSEASGQVNAALRVGGKYTPEQLAGLEGMNAEYLKGLVCDLAMVRLWGRRPEGIPDHYRDVRDNVLALLAALKNGDNIFDLPENVDATIIDHDGPTVVDLENRKDITTRMRRYFPGPEERIPRSRGGD